VTPEDLVPDMTIVYAYTLPFSVKDSPHWNGTDEDLTYAVKVPPRGTLMAAIAAMQQQQGSPFDLVLPNVVAVGGKAVTRTQVDEWFDRLPFKAQAMISEEFGRLLCATDDEKRSHRDSRKRL
jgi:hypothetical protein